jgi:myosin heavy subunit
LEIANAETLTVIKDQAELRFAPQAESKVKTLMLRNTKVEWAGNRTGAWLEVKLSSGLQGWVLANALSTPKTTVQTGTTRAQPAREAATSTEPPAFKQPPLRDDSEELKKKEEELNKLNQSLLAQQAELKAKENELKVKENELKAKEGELKARPDTTDALKKKDQEIDQLKQVLLERQAEVKAKENEIKAEIKTKEAELKSKTDIIEQLTEELNTFKAQASQSNNTNGSLQESLEKERTRVKDLENQITQLQKTLSDRSKNIETLSAENISLKQQMSQGKSEAGWPVFVVPILLVLLAGVAYYAYRSRSLLNAAKAPVESGDHLDTATIEEKETSAIDDGMTAETGSEVEVDSTPQSMGEEDTVSKWVERISPDEAIQESTEVSDEAHTRRIELESETVDISIPSVQPISQNVSLTPSDSAVKGSYTLPGDRFDIRLIHVGDKRDKVLQMLFKVKGLVRAPEDLLNSVPCTIARSVERFNAEKFRHYMNRVGATIELVRSEED